MTRRSFLLLWLVLAGLKLVLAWGLPLFGDEAFYWWESRWPAWAYSDLPPLTAWLIALGTQVPGGEIAVRWPFLLLGLLLPWQVVWLARRSHGGEVAWRAGILALSVPLAFATGVLALPDAVMASLTVAAVHLLLRAAQDPGRAAPWLLLGGVLALGLLCHYRFAAVPLVIALAVPALSWGRRALRTPWPWLAALLALLALLPVWWLDAAHDYAGLRFQFVDRHPWRFQWNGLLQPLEQALVAGPVMLALLAAVVWQRGRGAAGPSDRLLAILAGGVWILFVALGFFADSERFRWHWSFPAYLLAMPLLAAHWPVLGARVRSLAAATSMVLVALVAGYFLAGMAPRWQTGLFDGKRFPANFAGWREVAAWQRAQDTAGNSLLVVDNFMLAAAITYYLQPEWRDGVRVLDDPLNARHGRAAQLSIWGLDEAALAAQPPRPGWLLVEETARRFSDRWPWYQSLCSRFAGLRLDGVLDLYGGRKRFVRFRHQGYAPQAGCTQPDALPPLGWVDGGQQRLRRGEPLLVEGWVVQAGQGIGAVELLLEDEPVASAPRTLPAAWAIQTWGDPGDPAGEMLGFRLVLDTSDLPRGRHSYRVIAHRPDGLEWPIHSGWLEVE